MANSDRVADLQMCARLHAVYGMCAVVCVCVCVNCRVQVYIDVCMHAVHYIPLSLLTPHVRLMCLFVECSMYIINVCTANAYHHISHSHISIAIVCANDVVNATEREFNFRVLIL